MRCEKNPLWTQGIVGKQNGTRCMDGVKVCCGVILILFG